MRRKRVEGEGGGQESMDEIRRYRIAQVEFKVVQDGFEMRYRTLALM